MKEVIGKGKLVNNSLPKHLILNNRNIFDQKNIANSFNEYFVNGGQKLVCVKYLSRKDHLRSILKNLTALLKRYPYLMKK